MTPALSVRELTVDYRDFTLGPLSFTLGAGERLALVGTNGAGKSTTLRALAGRTPNYAGSIAITGREVRDALPTIRADIGLLDESVTAYPWMSVAEHLRFVGAFYPRWDAARADRLLSRLGVSPRATMGTLSRGTRIKVGFIAATSHHAPLLLLDEPTAGLDPGARRELLEAVRGHTDEAAAASVIFSTHILEDVELLADRVLVILQGKLIMDSPIAALRSGTSLTVVPALVELLRVPDAT